MVQEDIIVGLDIGTTKVCAVIGMRNDNGGLDIIGVGKSPSSGLRRGVVINIEATQKAVVAAIEAAEMMSGRDVQSVITGIAGAQIEGINSRGVVAVTGKGREITADDVQRVIEAAKAVVIPMDREVLHVIPQEYIVDEQNGIKNPIDIIGVRLEAEVHIITGSVMSTQNLLRCVNRAGFRVQEIVLQSLASSRAVLSEDEKDLGVLLIDLGGGTTDVLVFLDGAPYHTDVVALGGHQVTSDLSIVLKTPLEAAENMKIQAGCCYLPMIAEEEFVDIPGVGGWPASTMSRGDLCKIIQPRMTEIFGLVREQMEKKNYLGHLGGGVVLTGGGALMPGAIDLAQEVFQLPARVGYPAEMGGLAPEYRNPAYSTGVGLVMHAAEMLEKNEYSAERKKGINPDGVMAKLKNWMKEFF